MVADAVGFKKFNLKSFVLVDTRLAENFVVEAVCVLEKENKQFVVTPEQQE
jgi:hypothetical protein